MRLLNKYVAAIVSVALAASLSLFQYDNANDLSGLAIDAQGGFIEASTLFITVIFLFVLTFTIYKTLMSYSRKDRKNFILYGVCVCLLVSFSLLTVKHSIESQRALHDSANPDTSPDRLRELVGFKTSFGYEVDNRLARNPSTPVDVIEELYGLSNQIGTQKNLAINPKTPDHILIELSKIEDPFYRPHIISNLQRNPKVQNKELVFDASFRLRKPQDS